MVTKSSREHTAGPIGCLTGKCGSLDILMQSLHEGQLGLGMDIHHMLMDITDMCPGAQSEEARKAAQATTTVTCQVSKL